LSLPHKGKLLGLDLGSRRTGVAITDIKQSIIFLREEVQHTNKEDLLKQLQELCQNENPVGAVLGLPRLMSGKDSEQTEKTRAMGEYLMESLKLPYIWVDERLSSHLAQKDLPKGALLDSQAARLILELHLGLY
jgi:putative Holliday junction resolvase